MGRPSVLTERDKQNLDAILADRRGIDARMQEIHERLAGIAREMRTLHHEKEALDVEYINLQEQRLAICNKALAEKLEVSPTTILYYERGRTRWSR